MKSKKPQNVLENGLLLNEFVQKAWFEPQTPSIIRLVSSNADYMVLCAAIVNDADSTPFLRSVTLTCRQKGIDINILREKLIPVANALGLRHKPIFAQDYYHILGITPAASANEIKKAFRQKARTVHPDTNHSGKSQSCAFVELHEAYQTLSNPKSRRQYDRKCHSAGLWNEQRFQNQRPPRKSGYIYMIGGLAFLFITAAFLFDFIFREEVLFDISYTDEQPPISAPKRTAPLKVDAQDNKLLKSESKSQTSEPQTSDDKKTIKKTISRIGPIEYIDTEKHTALLPETYVSPPPPIDKKSNNKQSAPSIKEGFRASGIPKKDNVTIVPAPSPTVLSKSDAKDHQTPFRAAKNSVSSTVSTPRPEKDRGSIDHKDKIDNFLKMYCMAYEQKNLKKFASFFKSDAIENGKPFHTLLPQYRRNFATIASITYTIIMHKYSYLSDSKDIKIEGDFFLRWREYGANWKKNSGSVFMHLEHSKNSFLVKQLYYLGEGHNGTKTQTRDHAIALVAQNDPSGLKRKVERFLIDYCQAYQNKNLIKFASFFRPGATENGKPFDILLPQYRHNFSMIDSMKYDIVIHNHSRIDAETVKIEGAFSVRWYKYKGNWSKNSGSISMMLSEEDNSLRVKALNYRND